MSDLSELFERDPLSLTKDDPAIVKMIEAYRAMRVKFDMGDMKAGSTKPRATSKKPPSLAAALADSIKIDL